MRVLHLYGGQLAYGGVERLLVSLAEFAAAAPGFEQAYALCYAGPLWEELRAAGAPVHALGAARISRPWRVAGARQRLRRWAGGQNFQWAVCHAWWSYAMFGPALRRAGIPVALWAHDCAGSHPWLERWAKRHAPACILTHGHFVAASLGQLFPAVKILRWLPPIPVPATIAPAQRAHMRQDLNTRDDDIVILQAGRLERWKGHRVLLEALSQLGRGAPWVAWLIGDAQHPRERAYAAELREQAQQLGIGERIRWLGRRSDVATLMQAADLFCQPNTKPEPFGKVFLEALAAGLPVVTTATGGAVEIVTPDCGCLTEPGAAAVAGALQAIMANPPHRHALASAAVVRVRQLCDPMRQMHALPMLLAEALP